MLLAIDIGNTNISLALFHGSKMAGHWDIPAGLYATSRLSAKIRAKNISGALICSVVPALTKKLAQDVKRLTGIKPRIIGKDIRVPMKNLYCRPAQLGQDRLVNAYAAGRIYGSPVIVVSCGTAITVDAVSKNMFYLGGFILPGLRPCLAALKAHTALLPKIGLTPGLAAGIPRNTREAILNGVILGSAGAVNALIRRIRLETGKKTVVIGTGGDIDLLKKFSGYIIKADKELTLKGILLCA